VQDVEAMRLIITNTAGMVLTLICVTCVFGEAEQN